jgi:hypothetical protein
MMRGALRFGFSFLLAMASPSIALAADPDPPPLPPPATSDGATATPSASATVDSVHLRNGGLYRGRVTEIVPGDHVTVQIEKGEMKKVPWAEIDRVIVASTAIPAPPTSSSPSAAPATPPVAAPMVGPRARVHISSSKSLILYRRPAGSSSWVQACTSPCNQELPIGDTYRVTGNAVASSKEFRLDAQPGGQVDIAVDPPSTAGMVFGGFVGAGGASAAYIGMLMALIGASDASKDCYSNSYSCANRTSDGEKLRNAGLITMGIGTGLTVAGILIFLASAKTDIAQSSGKGTDTAAGASPPKPVDAFLRQPTWKTAGSSTEHATSAPAAAFPLVLQGTF